MLFVSGTIGLDEKGNAPEGLDDQLAVLWSNIRRILAEANMTTDNIVRLTSYLRHADFTQANAKARLLAPGGGVFQQRRSRWRRSLPSGSSRSKSWPLLDRPTPADVHPTKTRG